MFNRNGRKVRKGKMNLKVMSMVVDSIYDSNQRKNRKNKKDKSKVIAKRY
jgi:hypothetical protein